MKKRGIRILAVMLAMVLMLGEGNVLHAMEGDYKEENTELGSEECGEETVSESETGIEESEIDISEKTEEESEEFSEEETEEVSEYTSEKTIFPGVPSEWEFSEAENEARKLLADNIDEAGSFEEGVDCVANEILVAAEGQEEAMLYAEAFGGTLLRYVAGVAVVQLRDTEDGTPVTVKDAVRASMDASNRLPVAWPNTYYYLMPAAQEGVIEENGRNTEEEAGEVCSVYDDKYLNPGYSFYQWYHHVIGSAQAWRAGYTGAGIKVAVLDSGVRFNHEDLQITGTTVLEDSAEDNLGHGTHVCGIIGATLNNEVGGAGIAPDATVYSIKVTDQNNVTTDDMLAGMQAAKNYGADILNISISGPYYNALLEEQIKILYNSGIAVFCAAGNEGVNAYAYPASYEGAISVGAIDESLQTAEFSNYGIMIDYAAPGNAILSTLNTSETEYGLKSGTSSACSVAAGSAAVVLQYARQKGLLHKEGTAADVERLMAFLDQGAVNVKSAKLGRGYISLPKALGLSQTVDAPAVTVIPGTYEEESITVGFYQIPGTEIYYSVNGKKPVVEGGQILYAEKYTEPFTVSDSTVTVKAIAIDLETREVSKVLTATYILKPKVTGISLSAQGSDVLSPGQTVTLKATIEPIHAANKKLSWTISPAGEGVTVQNGVVKVSKRASEGVYTIRATAKDGTYVKGFYKITVTQTCENPITSIKQTVPGTVYVNKTTFAKVEITVTKKDKTTASPDELRWYSANSKVADVICSDGEVKILGLQKGATKIIGIAEDGSGKKITIPVEVVIKATSLTTDTARELARGKTITIQSEVLPVETTNKKLTWSVTPANKGVTVKNGKVSATSKAVLGEYTIEAKTKDGSALVSNTTVTVVSSKITKIVFKETKVNVFRVKNNYGAKTHRYVYLSISGSGTDNWEVTSSDPELLEVTKTGNNEIYMKATGKGCGTVKVTVKTTDGTAKKTICKVKVINPPSNMWVSVPKDRSENLAKGKSMQLKVTFEDGYGPLSAESKKIEWSSTRPENISVNAKGKVTAKSSSGTSSVYAKTMDGSGVFATIYLYATCVPKEITLGGKNTIKEGESSLYYIECFASGEGDVYHDSVRVMINKEGLGFSPIHDSKFYLIGNKKGVYKVTIYTTDGTNRKRTYRICVE